jgi:two-component system sensor kinase FixL
MSLIKYLKREKRKESFMKNNNLDVSSITINRSSLFYAILLGLVVAITIALVWLSLNNLQQVGNEDLTLATNSGAETLIKTDNENQNSSISRLARWWTEYPLILRKNAGKITSHPLSNIFLTLLILLSALTALSTYIILISRKQANLIRSNRKRMEHLFKNLPGMAYRSFNLKDWPTEFVNEGCQSLSGYSKIDFEQRHIFWGKLIHPDDYDKVNETIQQAIKSDGVFEIEYRIRTKNKKERWVRERGEAFNSNTINVIRLEGFIIDITAEKLFMIKLFESRAFSAAMLEAVVEAVITINDKNIIETFNRTAQEMFGYTFDEVIGKNIKMLMPKQYSKEYDRYLSRYLKDGEPRTSSSSREVNARRKDGSIFKIHVSLSEVLNITDRKFIGLIRDLSQQHALEKKTREQIEQLAHADRLNLLGEMTAGIAHEINQPLTAISLFAQAGKRLFESGNHERLPETLNKMSEHAQRAGAVIERIQMMAKQGDNIKEAIKCNVLVEEVVKLAEIEARTRNILIKMDTSIELPIVCVDQVQIQQVILNLLRNSMDAMASINCQHGNVILLQVQFNDKKNIEIHIIDSGCGVSKQAEAKLFTPFSSTKNKGMGMGLSISKSIITEHGGWIQFQNNSSVGSTFYFTLPIENRKILRSL